MDPDTVDIDPAWWEEVLRDPTLEAYPAPELLSGRFDSLLKEDDLSESRRSVLEVLARVTSAMLSTDDWQDPFVPAFIFGGQRSALPSDLSTEEVALLARIAPQVEAPALRARLADVAWLYGDRSNSGLLYLAVDSYCAAPLTDDVWFGIGRDAWKRAFDLVNRRGADGHPRAAKMTAQLREHVLSGTPADRFRIPQAAEVLRHYGRMGRDERTQVAESLAFLAAAAIEDPRLSRHLEREAAAYYDGADAAARSASLERVARTYIAEADARVATDPQGGALVEGHFLEKAIATLRELPRSFRQENELDSLIEQLRHRMQASRESALEAMERIETDPVDLSGAVSYARAHVAGHADVLQALLMFSTLAPQMDVAASRESATQIVTGSISRLFSSSTFSRDARKVAASPGVADGVDEDAVWREVVRAVTIRADMIAMGMIRPAQEVLISEHRMDRPLLQYLCVESPAVPEGHSQLWASGLALGLAGELGPAVSLVVPQLEQGSSRVTEASWSIHAICGGTNGCGE